MAVMARINTPNKRTTTVSSEATDYGLWSLVILNSAVFIFFAFSFFKPQNEAGLALNKSYQIVNKLFLFFQSGFRN